MKIYFFLVLLLFCSILHAQEGRREIEIIPSLNDTALELGKKYYVTESKDSITFETIKFYLSHLQFFQEEELVGTLEKKHLLIDLENPASLVIPDLPDKKFNKIRFKLGVDSLTSVSGAFGEDLDPTNGMYWTWQSGYIHVKLEGVADNCPARNHAFQFHLGGYQAPFNSIQELELPILDGQKIQLEVSLNKFLSQINLEEQFQVMSPNAQAVEIAEQVSSIFSIVE